MNIQNIAQQINHSFSESDVKRILRDAVQGQSDKVAFLDSVLECVRGLFEHGDNWRMTAIESVKMANGGVKVGMGATMFGYTDHSPYTVVAVSPSGKTVTLQADSAELDPNWKPEVIPGGFAGHCVNNDSQQWIIKPNPSAPLVKVRLQKDGSFKTAGGSTVAIGYRSKFHDYNF
jgi:hypothetical protein